MRVILADPPMRGGWRVANHPNLGILYLSGYLKREIAGLEVLYLEQQLSPSEHLEKVRAFAPHLYGLSFSSMLLDDAATTLGEVRALCPDLPIICGGPHPSAMPEQVARIPGVDACVIGEGEMTVTELARHFLFQEKKLEEIAGIAYLKEGQVLRTAQRPLIRDLDGIGLPDWDLIDFSRYSGNYQYKASPSTAMIVSRGCPYDCNFCSNPVWKVSKPWVRMRGPKDIQDEVRLLYQKGIRDIYIRSDEANVDIQWCVDVFRGIRDLGYKDLYFQCNMHAGKITDQVAELYAEMGGWLVYLGIESGNDRTLAGIGKRVTTEQIVNASRTLKRFGIDVFGLFMIYHVWEESGELRCESAEEVNAGTLGFIHRLRREGLIDYISFTTTTPMPGSRLYATALKHGLIPPDFCAKDLSGFSMQLPGVSLSAMKRSRLRGMLLQLLLVLKSGRTVWADWGKLKIKAKYLWESLLP